MFVLDVSALYYTIVILAFILIVFEGFSRIAFRKHFRTEPNQSFFPWIFLVLMLLFMVPCLMSLFDLGSFTLAISAAILLSVVCAIPSFTSALSRQHQEFLIREGAIGMVLLALAFLIADIMALIVSQGIRTLSDAFLLLLQHVLVGVGIGVIFGIVIFDRMRHRKANLLVHLALLCTAILAYIVAEELGGNGIIAVAAFGVFFMNTSISETAELHHLSTKLQVLLEGLALALALLFLYQYYTLVTWMFALKALAAFAVAIIIRLFALALAREISFGSVRDRKEALRWILLMPKGKEVLIAGLAVGALNLGASSAVAMLVLFVIALSYLVGSLVVHAEQIRTWFSK